MELISKLWKKRMMVIKWCIVGALIGLVAGFSIPKTYVAETVIASEDNDSKVGGLSSLASIAGINMNTSVDAISVDMFPDVVHSTPFIVELFDLPVQFERKGETIETTLLDYMLEYQKSPWWTPIIQFPFKALGWVMSIGKEEVDAEVLPLDPANLPKDERAVVKYFEDNILISVDKKTGKTSLALTMQDPKVVHVVLSEIMSNLKTYISDYRSAKARQDVENLSVICAERKADYYKAQQAYARYADANKNVILQSANAERERLQQEMNLAYQVYSQVATQLEGARIQEQQSKPVFTVVQPPVVPIRAAAPSKIMMLLTFVVLACGCSIVWVIFGQDLWTKFKENL
jgi:uncharacterized protein involved in exopolysaccharide biosynthesis